MSGIRLDKFGGQLPAWDETLLPRGQAAISIDADVFSGALSGWRAPTLLRSLTNSAAAMVYRVPVVTEAFATVNLLFAGNPNEGDTVKVGEFLYTFTATVTDPYDVLIGASANASATNLFAAFTGGDGAGTLYGTGTVPNSDISDTADANTLDTATIGVTSYPWIKLQAPEIGAAFNTTVVQESTSNVRLTWLSSTGSLSNTTGTFTGGANASFNNDITGSAKWLEFEDPDTAVMRSPVVDDQYGRHYIMSPSLPPRYNTYDRIQADEDPWTLGVPAPGCAPTIEVAGGGDDVQRGWPTQNGTDTEIVHANYVYMFKLTPDAALQLNDLAFISSTTDENARVMAVLFDDVNGAPFQLLNYSETITGIQSGSQVTCQFINPTGLLAGTAYWIGFMTDTQINVPHGATDNLTYTAPATFANGPPPYSSTLESPVRAMQMWANLVSDATLSSRSYVYTWVTEYGEEGPPSPFTLVTGWSNGVWNVGLYTPPTDDMGVVRNITKTRIYRTVSGSTGLARYYFVAEVPVTTETYVDENGDDVVSLNSELASANFFEPPEGLQGLVAMPNGMAAAFKENEVWFCESYRPHAWPPGYVITTEFPVVGLGVVGQSLVICTAGHPYVATGPSPSSMVLDKVSVPEPCISRGSIVSTDNGVFYASPNGLIRVTSGGALQNTTDEWVTREKWASLTPPKFLRAILLKSGYVGFGTVFNGDDTYAQQGFCIELSDANRESFTVYNQPGGHRIGFTQLTAPNDFDIYNVQVDPWTGIGLLIQNSKIYYYDFSNQSPTILPYRWRSKLFSSRAIENYSALKVFFDILNTTPELNAYRKEDPTDDASWDTLDADRYGYIRVFADGTLVTVRELRTSGELLRILSGFKAEHWQIEIEARVIVTEVQMATSSKELALM